MIYLLAAGSDYPGKPYELPDCALDVSNVAAAFAPYVKMRKTLIDDQLTAENIKKAVANIAQRMTANDAVICYFSGHGTTQQAGKLLIQGIVMNDGSVLWEHELRTILAALPTAMFIADSCFSGGLSRVYRKGHADRFVPFSKLRDAQSPILTKRIPSRRYDYFAACSGTETAASTGTGGAFTTAALQILTASDGSLTMRGLYRAIRKVLPNQEYNQTPQFFASDEGFARRTLKSFIAK